MKTLLLTPFLLIPLLASGEETPAATPHTTRAEFEAHARADLQKELKAQDDAKSRALLEKLDALKAGTAPSPEAIPGQWRVVTSISPIDDSRTISISAESSLIEGDPRRDQPIVGIRRQEGKVEAIVVPPGGLIWQQHVDVTIRWDSEKAQEQSWVASDNQKALFSTHPREFIAKALTSRRLIVRVQPPGASTQTMSFDLASLAAVFKPYSEEFQSKK
jgi:hypothetical protein